MRRFFHPYRLHTHLLQEKRLCYMADAIPEKKTAADGHDDTKKEAYSYDALVQKLRESQGKDIGNEVYERLKDVLRDGKLSLDDVSRLSDRIFVALAPELTDEQEVALKEILPTTPEAMQILLIDHANLMTSVEHDSYRQEARAVQENRIASQSRPREDLNFADYSDDQLVQRYLVVKGDYEAIMAKRRNLSLQKRRMGRYQNHPRVRSEYLGQLRTLSTARLTPQIHALNAEFQRRHGGIKIPSYGRMLAGTEESVALDTPPDLSDSTLSSLSGYGEKLQNDLDFMSLRAKAMEYNDYRSAASGYRSDFAASYARNKEKSRSQLALIAQHHRFGVSKGAAEWYRDRQALEEAFNSDSRPRYPTYNDAAFLGHVGRFGNDAERVAGHGSNYALVGDRGLKRTRWDAASGGYKDVSEDYRRFRYPQEATAYVLDGADFRRNSYTGERRGDSAYARTINADLKKKGGAAYMREQNEINDYWQQHNADRLFGGEFDDLKGDPEYERMMTMLKRRAERYGPIDNLRYYTDQFEKLREMRKNQEFVETIINSETPVLYEKEYLLKDAKSRMLDEFTFKIEVWDESRGKWDVALVQDPRRKKGGSYEFFNRETKHILQSKGIRPTILRWNETMVNGFPADTATGNIRGMKFEFTQPGRYKVNGEVVTIGSDKSVNFDDPNLTTNAEVSNKAPHQTVSFGNKEPFSITIYDESRRSSQVIDAVTLRRITDENLTYLRDGITITKGAIDGSFIVYSENPSHTNIDLHEQKGAGGVIYQSIPFLGYDLESIRDPQNVAADLEDLKQTVDWQSMPEPSSIGPDTYGVVVPRGAQLVVRLFGDTNRERQWISQSHQRNIGASMPFLFREPVNYGEVKQFTTDGTFGSIRREQYGDKDLVIIHTKKRFDYVPLGNGLKVYPFKFFSGRLLDEAAALIHQVPAKEGQWVTLPSGPLVHIDNADIPAYQFAYVAANGGRLFRRTVHGVDNGQQAYFELQGTKGWVKSSQGAVEKQLSKLTPKPKPMPDPDAAPAAPAPSSVAPPPPRESSEPAYSKPESGPVESSAKPEIDAQTINRLQVVVEKNRAVIVTWDDPDALSEQIIQQFKNDLINALQLPSGTEVIVNISGSRAGDEITVSDKGNPLRIYARFLNRSGNAIEGLERNLPLEEQAWANRALERILDVDVPYRRTEEEIQRKENVSTATLIDTATGWPLGTVTVDNTQNNEILSSERNAENIRKIEHPEISDFLDRLKNGQPISDAEQPLLRKAVQQELMKRATDAEKQKLENASISVLPRIEGNKLVLIALENNKQLGEIQLDISEDASKSVPTSKSASAAPSESTPAPSPAKPPMPEESDTDVEEVRSAVENATNMKLTMEIDPENTTRFIVRRTDAKVPDIVFFKSQERIYYTDILGDDIEVGMGETKEEALETIQKHLIKHPELLKTTEEVEAENGIPAAAAEENDAEDAEYTAAALREDIAAETGLDVEITVTGNHMTVKNSASSAEPLEFFTSKGILFVISDAVEAGSSRVGYAVSQDEALRSAKRYVLSHADMLVNREDVESAMGTMAERIEKAFGFPVQITEEQNVLNIKRENAEVPALAISTYPPLIMDGETILGTTGKTPMETLQKVEKYILAHKEKFQTTQELEADI